MTLSLDIFIFQLIKSRARTEEDKKPVSFDAIYDTLKDEHQSQSPLIAFTKQLVQSFDTSFRVNEKTSKAISFCNMDTFQIRSDANEISGQFIGGPTGVKAEVYKNADSTNSTHVINEDEVTALPYYFKIWFPTEFNTGVLIVQRYSISSCLGLFRQQLSDFFKNKGYKLLCRKFVPEEYRNSFIENCKINAIEIKHPMSIENQTRTDLSLLKAGKLRSKIVDLAVSAAKLISDSKMIQEIKRDVATLDSNYNEGVDTLRFYYVNEKGETASSTYEELQSMIPSVKLTGPRYLDGSGRPDMSQIEKVATEYLAAIKRNLSYS